MTDNLIRRLRERRMLAMDGLPDGAGRTHAKMMWVTNEPDPDCAAAAAEIERLLTICTTAHDRLLRGDDDRDLLALLATAWEDKR